MRRRWLYTHQGRPLAEPVEVGPDWTQPTRPLAVVTDLYMDGTRATDGTDISSRKKRRAYMRTHGLADASDYQQTWARAAQERERFFSGQARDPTRREDLARALHQPRRRR